MKLIQITQKEQEKRYKKLTDYLEKNGFSWEQEYGMIMIPVSIYKRVKDE